MSGYSIFENIDSFSDVIDLVDQWIFPRNDLGNDLGNDPNATDDDDQRGGYRKKPNKRKSNKRKIPNKKQKSQHK